MKNHMNVSWGFIWQQKDKYQHAVLANWGAASIEWACRIQSTAMAGIAGSPYIDSYLYSPKLHCFNSSFHHDLFFMHSWDWTFEEIRDCLFMIWHELQAGASWLPIEPLNRDWHSDSISSCCLDGTRFTESPLGYRILAPRIYKLFTMLLTQSWKGCEIRPVRESVVYMWAGVAGHLQSRWAKAGFWDQLSQAAAQLWSSNDKIYYRILETYKVSTYILVKIQLNVVTDRLGECIYGKCIVGTFLQLMGWHRAWNLWHFSSGLHIPIVLATRPGNPPAAWVWTAKTGRFGSRPVQKPEPLTLCGLYTDPYSSTLGFHRIWLDLSVPISGSAFLVSHLW